jgi:hypothetical protein
MISRDVIESTRKRLRGAWGSDRERTMAHWVFPKRIAAQKRKRFASFFGHNTMRFTRTRMHWTFEDRTTVGRYEILWADDESAVVLFRFPDGDSCHQLFLRDDHFYLVTGPVGNIEYFGRAPSNSRSNGRAGKTQRDPRHRKPRRSPKR